MSFLNMSTAPKTISRVAALSATTSVMCLASAAFAHDGPHLEDMVEQVSPSVVTILASTDAKPVAYDERGGFRNSPFEEFFRQFSGPRGYPEQHGQTQPRNGLGSGFIVEADGWIVTNNHVIEGADNVTVRLSDEREYEAEVIGVDPKTDIALLRIEAEDALPYIELGDSSETRVGETVFAMGNPFGLGGTVTQGIVSAKGREISQGPYADFIQTDAAINKGNSGGPLFNMEGEVIGVNSAIYSPNGGSVGIGFAVSANIVADIVDDLKDDGQVSRGWLGVSIQQIDQDMANALGLDEPQGALVADVTQDSPSSGKLQPGDVILEFNGDTLDALSDLPKLVAATDTGEEVDVKVLRDGKKKTVSIEIGTLPDQDVVAQTHGSNSNASDSLGVTVAQLTDQARAELGLDQDAEGVVITSMSANSVASNAGLRVGDVIVRLGSQEISAPRDLDRVLEAHGDAPAMMLINRHGSQVFVAVKVA
ncbi:Do family serine endopeptidase [Falsihalocynthiibacter sp. SS001]|uniref:Do family serine endopeptidase n=1 Tax=Falsihalocynthiibacter sp. SS001 TaxID=3349698 RepID=UPI0036D2A39A